MTSNHLRSKGNGALTSGQLVDSEGGGHGGERARLEFCLERLVVLVAEPAAALGVAA